MRRILAKAVLVIIITLACAACATSQESNKEPKNLAGSSSLEDWEWWQVKRVMSHAQGEMVGEVTQNSAILQSRLTWGNTLIDDRPGWPDGDLPGCPGISCFEISTSDDFEASFKTEWLEAVPEHDFIVKTKVAGLKPGTRYYYRLIYGPNEATTVRGDLCTFKTLAGEEVEAEASFVVVTGMNYYSFHHHYNPPKAYKGEDKHFGYPALETILKLKPDFFVATGDNVYYDHPSREVRAQTQAELRRKWHEQFILPRFVTLFAQVPTYWEKDDHDYRYNDCDPYGDKKPSHQLGIATFLEQVPIVDPKDRDPVTYRTHRVNKHLQIWLVEGRDYRSSNDRPDGPAKTLWGQEQKEWLKQTLLESNATFKMLISPTPMVGPDDGYKRDNHTNPKGFRYEGEAFFEWLKENDFLAQHFYIICGDRHWQYHSVHPSGFEEFSCGALVDANSRLGRKPGDEKSTDPEAKVKQLYTYEEPTGGFLRVTVKPDFTSNSTIAEFSFYDEKGTILYTARKEAKLR
jgi:alkaline phosphatase/alkaline phosphatase D